jgi:Uncharacterized protein conserved in bacteria
VYAFLFALTLSSVSAQLPQSKRSLDAIKRVTPELQQALAQKNLTLGAPVFLRIFKQEKTLEAWVRGSDDRFVLSANTRSVIFRGSSAPNSAKVMNKRPKGFTMSTRSG